MVGPEKKLRLCIETSGETASLAVFAGKGKELGQLNWSKKKSGQELATYSLKNLLTDLGKRVDHIGSIALSQGPGSFTGLRVGFNLARTLCFSLNIPVLLVDSLKVQAFPITSTQPNISVVVINNAFRNLFFFSRYQNLQTLKEPTVLTAEQVRMELKPHDFVLGNGLDLLRSLSPKSLDSLLNTRLDLRLCGTASNLGILSYVLSQITEITDYKMLIPLYLRPAQAEENLALGVIKPQT